MPSILLPSCSLRFVVAHFLLILICCYTPFNESFLITSVTGSITDSLALLSFKSGLISDPLEVTASWNDSSDFCRWIGVTCSLRHHRVVRLDLRSSMLVGSLSPSIGNLSFLKEFVLFNNSFTGRIPPEIGRLSRLQILSLENNSFSGEVPRNISRCSNLIKLGLGGNSLIGSIPMEFQLLSKLQIFFLYLNKLTGELPPFLGNLSSLISISVGGNFFVGNIPDTLGHLKNLEIIELGMNDLSGSFPPSFFNISSLTNIDIPFNQLQGSLPSDMFIPLPRLQKLNVARNNLTGNIPSSVSNATELMLLGINGNGFSGKVPSFEGTQNLDWLALNRNELGYGRPDDLNFMSSLLNCTKLYLLHLSENNFKGVLPRFLGNFSKLRRFTVGKNMIHGSIPDEIGEIVDLETMYLWSNQITGSIPDSIGKLRELRILSLMDNKLSGEIPSSFGNLTMLTDLYLQINTFQGTIPSSIGKCQSLLAVDISHNNLTGYLPKEIFSLSFLSEFLDISSNSLIGSLPSDFSSLQHLVLLNLSNNMLSGSIPNGFVSLIGLRELCMDNNLFQGILSPSLSSLKSLEILDLSCNKFTGEIPVFLENFTFLRSLNLSYNDFEGEVPKRGVFQNAREVSVVGNPKLCGGIHAFELPLCHRKETSNRSGLSHKQKLKVIFISSSISVLILAVLLVIAYYQKQRKKLISLENPGKEFLPPISFQNLYKATNGFSEANLIGSGKFSSVYRGIVDQNETVAVKVLKLQIKGARGSFMAECEALRCIRHRNLIKILTSCSGVDFQGNEFKALVYEHMVNGSLEDWLHKLQGKGEKNQEPMRHLTLIQRLNIAIDVASALDYLHHHCGTPLVHCDIKPSNVLLDSDFVAHVGDFGLARFIQEANLSFFTSQNNSTVGIKGSIGYVAPEYGMGIEPSIFGDLYSYGILLLELFTGKSPTNNVFSNGLTLHNFAKMGIPEHVMEITDPSLVHDHRTKDTNEFSQDEIMKCLVSVFRIGISCSMEFPRERMEITKVINELYSIRNALLR